MPEEEPLDAGQKLANSTFNFCRPNPGTAAQTRCLSQLLLTVADLVTSTGERPKLLEELAPVVQRITDWDFIVFSIHDALQDCFVRQFWTRSGHNGGLQPQSLTDSPSAWVWNHQRERVIADLGQEHLFPDQLAELYAHGVRSYTAVPLNTSLKQFGVLELGKYQTQVQAPEEMDFLIRVARMAAMVLESQETARGWHDQKDHLNRLAAISKELSGSLDLDDLLPIIFRHLHEVTNYDYAVLVLLDEGGKTVHAQASDLPGWKQPLPERAALEETTSAEAIRNRRVSFLDEEDVASMGGPVSVMLMQEGIRSVCSLPLISKDQVLGALNLGSKQKNGFSREKAAYLLEIAGPIGPAVENAKAYREIEQLKDRMLEEKHCLESEILGDVSWDAIVGTSAGLRHVLEAAAVVARTDATVLITGETGTGKERVARVIHTMSDRKDRSFIKLNCAAIPTGLLESELFGHEKGAFTGAVTQKIGRLELADKGTLFLDEIGDIPLELQPKLLRVLQDYEFERLGGTRTIRVNVRLIAATNMDLTRAVEEKQFRRDLFYRLHVFPIHLPPLRERRGDIPLLVRHFVQRCAVRLKKRIDRIPDHAIEVMMQWDWPGNVRELENFIERSVILSQSNVLQPPLAELESAGLQESSPDDTLRGREREHIVQVLRLTRGMLSGPAGAAERLGLKRTTLQYRMQKLGISRMDYLD